VKNYGLLIEYDYCTGCHSCEVACQQEHEYPVGKCGVKVTEFVSKGHKKPVSIDNVPFFTDACDLCASRTSGGEKPACVKHCQSQCMHYGPIDELAAQMDRQSRTVLFRPL